MSISVFFLNPVPATCKYISCGVITGPLLHPSKKLQGGKYTASQYGKVKVINKPKIASYPVATRKARLFQFRTMFSSKLTPGNTGKDWSSVSGQHHLSFHETFRSLKLHTRSQVLDSVKVPLCFKYLSVFHLLQTTAPCSFCKGEKWGNIL